MPLADKLNGGRQRDLRLLIANTEFRDTLEQAAERFGHREAAADAAEATGYPTPQTKRRPIAGAAAAVRTELSRLPQADSSQALVHTLIRLFAPRELRIHLQTRGRLHARALIVDRAMPDGDCAAVGTPNLTLGVTHATDLALRATGRANITALSSWFDRLWDVAEDFSATMLRELEACWAAANVTPYDIYMKTLVALLSDRLDGDDGSTVLWDDDITARLADFQRIAVRHAVRNIGLYGGTLIADVVGLGKSFVGAAVIKHFERTEDARPLIICPASLIDMWEHFNETYRLNARVLSMGPLRKSEDGSAAFLTDNAIYRDRNFVLIDESHNLRHGSTQRYRVLAEFMADGRRKCCLLTATPRNRNAWDVYHQLRLFLPDARTPLPINPPNLRDFFREIERGTRDLPEVLGHVLIRRKRNDILKYYGRDSETGERVIPSQFAEYADGRRRAYVEVNGQHQYFPRRRLQTVEYSIDAVYRGLYGKLRAYIGIARSPTAPVPGNSLTYARYGLFHYVRDDRRNSATFSTLRTAGANLCGLMRVMLFKRFESSVHAFRETVRRLVRVHDRFVTALQNGLIPAGEEAEELLTDPDATEDIDLLEGLQAIAGKYPASDLDMGRLLIDAIGDAAVLRHMLALVEPITPGHDEKLLTLERLLDTPPLRGGKRLLFTQFADTAQYLHDRLNPGGGRKDIDVICGADRKSRAKMAARFSPKSNPEMAIGGAEISTLVATDVLSEGLNLQDANLIVNYDLHWNPVRLIQRFGRIDRIGSNHDEVYGFNFLPESELDLGLGLRQILAIRIREIHETIGEDSAVLDPTERLNEQSMYDIYEGDGTTIDRWEEDVAGVGDLNEAEEFLRRLRAENPDEYRRIADIPDGVRCGMSARTMGTYLFVRAGAHRQLWLLDENGEIRSRDARSALAAIRCNRDEPATSLPASHNKTVSTAFSLFSSEMTSLRAEKDHVRTQTVGQRYALQAIQVAYAEARDDDVRGRLALLDAAFRRPVTPAISRELNALRRGGIATTQLIEQLIRVFERHRMRDSGRRDDGSVNRRIRYP